MKKQAALSSGSLFLAGQEFLPRGARLPPACQAAGRCRYKQARGVEAKKEKVFVKLAAGALSALLLLVLCSLAKARYLELASGPGLTKSEGTISKEVVVTVEEIAKPSQPAKPNGKWSVQVRAFSSRNESSELIKKLQHKGYDAYVVEAPVGGQPWYRVRVGNMATREEAQALLKVLKSKDGFSDGFLVQQ